MIDLSRVKTGFDVEILLGAGYFQNALLALREAGEMPATVEVGGHAVTLGAPQDLRILFESVPVPQGEGLQDLPTAVDFSFVLPLSSALGEINATLFACLDLGRKTNSVTGLVDTVRMLTRYVTMDPETRALLEMLRVDIQQVETQLRAIFDRDISEQLIPGKLTQMEIHKLPPDGEAPACYGVYVNLDLKVGELTQRVPASDADRFLGLADADGMKTVVAPPEPDEAPIARGDTALRCNFLPADMDLAFAAPEELYGRLARNFLHREARQRADGTWYRPLTTSGNREATIIGYHKGMRIRAHDGKLRVTSDTHVAEADVDVETNIDFSPSLAADGRLTWDLKVHEPEADTSFWDLLVGIFTFGLGLLLVPLTGGASLLLSGQLFGLGMGVIRSIKERYEGQGQEDLQHQMERDKDGLLSFMAVIPDGVTLSRRRVDPFFHRHYMVVTHFTEVRITGSGIAMGGRAGVGSEDRAIEQVSLVGRQRAEEPLGELQHLHWRVPNQAQVMDPARFLAPDPEQPDVFALTAEDALERVKVNQLRRQEILAPTAVRLRSGRITEIRFDTGVGLTPDEAGHLYQGLILTVPGRYRFVRIGHTDHYYLRSRPDGNEKNNLSQLPRY